MAKIRKLYDETIKPDGNKQVIYPITSTRAVYTPTNITIDSLLNEGYRFGGIVTPTDSPAFTNQRVFYGANVPGIYSHFDNITVDDGESIFIMYDGTSWTKGVFGTGGVGEVNIIEEIKVNGIALIPDSSKAVNIQLKTINNSPITGTGNIDVVTKSVDDLVNYYLKSETYTKDEVQQLISSVQGFTYELVNELPEASASTLNKIYLVPSSVSQTHNVKDEFITIDNGVSANPRYTWEQIGSTAIDLTGYVTTSDLNTALADYVTTTNLTTLLNGKQDTLVSGTNIKTVNGQSLVGSGDADVRSDWTETSSSAASYIKHKPNVAIIDEQVSQLSPLTLESTANKVTSISAQSTNVQYPSAKAVYDAIPKVLSGTTAYWNSRVGYVPDAGTIIIYTDKDTIDGVDVPGIKIGSGNGYVQDLAFVADDVAADITTHINNINIHVTAAEKTAWNGKIGIDETDGEVYNETIKFIR